MNIDEIYAEIPKAFGSWENMEQWAHEHDKPFGDSKFKLIMRIVHWFVDQSFEAGQNCGANYDRGVKYGYDKGYEEGKAEGVSQFEKTEYWRKCKEAEYKRGFEEAAKNPNAWYVLDANGEQVHIGDKVKYFNGVLTVFAINGDWIIPDESCRNIQADICEKVTPDPWEDLENELAAKLYEIEDFPAPFEIARKFVDRAKKIAGEEK